MDELGYPARMFCPVYGRDADQPLPAVARLRMPARTSGVATNHSLSDYSRPSAPAHAWTFFIHCPPAWQLQLKNLAA
jgi:hypothetical protein